VSHGLESSGDFSAFSLVAFMNYKKFLLHAGYAMYIGSSIENLFTSTV
jgi:hypothetical protein